MIIKIDNVEYQIEKYFKVEHYREPSVNWHYYKINNNSDITIYKSSCNSCYIINAEYEGQKSYFKSDHAQKGGFVYIDEFIINLEDEIILI